MNHMRSVMLVLCILEITTLSSDVASEAEIHPADFIGK